VFSASAARTLSDFFDLPQITVGGKPCLNVTMALAHKKLRCNLPAGFGAGNAVTVTRDGLSGTKLAALDYASPVIDAKSLRRFGQSLFVQGAKAIVNG
jgi:hypothetical protein